MRTPDRDGAIITMLLVTWILEAFIVTWTESSMDRMEKQITHLYATQADQMARLEEMRADAEEQSFLIREMQMENRIQNVRLAMHRDELTDNAQMYTDLLASNERMETYMKSLPDSALGIKVSDADLELIARLVYLECGSCSYRAQQAVASVIFNRMIRYGKTARQVIYEPNVFSPSGRVKTTTPSSSCRMAVREVYETGLTLPSNVLAFRNGHYHMFGRPYCSIDGIYFTKM